MNTLNREELEYLNGLVLVLEPSKAKNLRCMLSVYNSDVSDLEYIPAIIIGVTYTLRAENNPIALTIANKLYKYIQNMKKIRYLHGGTFT